MTLKSLWDYLLIPLYIFTSKGNSMFYRVYYKIGIGGKINEAKAQLKKDIDNIQRNFKEPKHKKRRAEREEMLKELQENLDKQIQEAEQSQEPQEISKKKTRTFGNPKPKAQNPQPKLQSRHFTKKDEAFRFMKQHYEFCQIMLIYKYSNKYGWQMVFDKYTPNDF
ncbi:hypothetical protein [Helicobacter cinaedi]|uniref:hypothetical protein n=2 Tax=Helicobacter cinaedi TaxID=213 RepID=UPI000DA1487F|nr:hypothetical protein [Helicobacter cinaedi]